VCDEILVLPASLGCFAPPWKGFGPDRLINLFLDILFAGLISTAGWLCSVCCHQTRFRPRSRVRKYYMNAFSIQQRFEATHERRDDDERIRVPGRVWTCDHFRPCLISSLRPIVALQRPITKGNQYKSEISER